MTDNESVTVISLYEVAKDVLLLYTTDFRGSNFFTYIADDEWGYRVLSNIVTQARSASENIVIALPIHAKTFRPDERDRVFFKVVEQYGEGRIRYEKEAIGEDFDGYLYHGNVDVAWGGSQKVTIVIYEPSTQIAAQMFLRGAMPPFNAVEVAQTVAAVVRHKGYCRLFCSRGLPPSSQDIDKHLTGDIVDVPFDMIVCPDIAYMMIKSDRTKKIDDREEFHLEYMAIASKYKQYSKLIGLKFAVIETCRKHRLQLGCGTLTGDKSIKKVDGKDVATLVGEEDYIVPRHLVYPDQIVLGGEPYNEDDG